MTKFSVGLYADLGKAMKLIIHENDKFDLIHENWFPRK